MGLVGNKGKYYTGTILTYSLLIRSKFMGFGIDPTCTRKAIFRAVQFQYIPGKILDMRSVHGTIWSGIQCGKRTILSCSLNSLRGLYRGLYWVRIKGDTRH